MALKADPDPAQLKRDLDAANEKIKELEKQVKKLTELLTAEGFSLDQNANGIPGEADDGYNFTLIVDTVPPRIVNHAPAGDVASDAPPYWAACATIAALLHG